MSSHASSSGSNGSSRWKSRDQLQSTKKAISKLGRGSSTSTTSHETKKRDRGGGGGGEAESEKQKKELKAKCVTVWSQVQLIRYVACAEIVVAVIIVLAQVRQ